MNHLEASVARRNQVLELLRLHRGTTLHNGALLAIPDEEIDAAMAEEAVLQPPGISLRAPHFIFTQVKPQIEAMYGKEGLYEQGLSVHTSIDIDLQDQSQVAMEKWIKEFENISNSRNGAAVIVSPGPARSGHTSAAGTTSVTTSRAQRQPRVAQLARLVLQALHLSDGVHEPRLGTRHGDRG